MKVKLFDFEDEIDLEKAINNFLDDEKEIVDIKYSVSSCVFSEEQIFCFSAMGVDSVNREGYKSANKIFQGMFVMQFTTSNYSTSAYKSQNFGFGFMYFYYFTESCGRKLC